MPATRWEQQYPDLFAKLGRAEAKAVRTVLSSHALEGLTPDRQLVARLIDFATGAITPAEYDDWAAHWASQQRGLPPSFHDWAGLG